MGKARPSSWPLWGADGPRPRVSERRVPMEAIRRFQRLCVAKLLDIAAPELGRVFAYREALDEVISRVADLEDSLSDLGPRFDELREEFDDARDRVTDEIHELQDHVHDDLEELKDAFRELRREFDEARAWLRNKVPVEE